MSREDIAKQPSVTFNERYESYEEANIQLTWLNQEDYRAVYELYITWMTHAQQRFGKTSHEYVCRLIAQKYNMTPFRVAGMIQLQHNEHRYKAEIQEQMQQAEDDPNKKPVENWLLPDEFVEILDDSMNRVIDESYEHTNEERPSKFFEPNIVKEKHEDHRYMSVDDVFDLDQVTKDAIIREKTEAQLMIDGHHYLQDMDDEDIPIPMSKKSKDLMQAKKDMAIKAESYYRKDPLLEKYKEQNDFKIPWPKKSRVDIEEEQEEGQEEDNANTDEDDRENQDESDTATIKKQAKKQLIPTKHHEIPIKYVSERPRWKYAAQIVDIHDIKMQLHEEKMASKKKIVGIQKARRKLPVVGYTNNSPKDTIVEIDATDTSDDTFNYDAHPTDLRSANMKDVKQLAWKPPRNVQEHVYAGAKQAWLDRTLRNKKGVWGKKNVYEGLF